MVKYCPKCGYMNDDGYDYCCKCGTSLSSNKKILLILIYLITILLSWGWVLIPKPSVISFCCLFFPFFFFFISNKRLKKHAYILMLICLTGSILNLIILFYGNFYLFP